LNGNGSIRTIHRTGEDLVGQVLKVRLQSLEVGGARVGPPPTFPLAVLSSVAFAV
jgi:hypothetical protein